MSGDAFRIGLAGVVLVVAMGGVYLKYEDMKPCVHPVSYAVGAVDARFGTTAAMVEREARAAATIWDTAEGKPLFVYDPNAALKIHLIYDEREANATRGAMLARAQVNLENERVSIEAARDQVHSQQDADLFNARIATYNADIISFNTKVSDYNQSAGHDFKEGEYVQDASGKRIDIYEFIGAAQLKRVLAHELGHALGLDHNSDPASIMYAENESGNLVPTTADLSALRTLCGS